MEPTTYAWILPGRLAVAERPGGGGRMHRRERRIAELDWWREQGVVAIVSGMRSRHALAEYAEDGFTVRWHPLRDPDQARQELPLLGGGGAGAARAPASGAVLVHCDRANEWLTAIDAALRLGLGLARTPRSALRAAAADGLPVGSLAASIVGRSHVGGGVTGCSARRGRSGRRASQGTAPMSPRRLRLRHRRRPARRPGRRRRGGPRRGPAAAPGAGGRAHGYAGAERASRPTSTSCGT